MYPRPIKNFVTLSILAVSFSTAYKISAMAPQPISSDRQVKELDWHLRHIMPVCWEAIRFCKTFSTTQPNKQDKVLCQFNDDLKNLTFPSIKAVSRSIERLRLQLFANITPEFEEQERSVSQLRWLQKDFTETVSQSTAIKQALLYAKTIKKAQGALPKRLMRMFQPDQTAEGLPVSTTELSCSATFWPIFKAIEILGGDWTPINSYQQEFLHYYGQYKADLRMFSEQEMKTKASDDYKVINQFLKDHDFDIQLDPFGRDKIGFAAIMKYLVEWQTEGTACEIESTRTKQIYPAFFMNNFSIYFSQNHNHEIFAIPTKTNDTAFITKVDSPLDHSILLKFINTLQTTMKHDRILGINASAKLTIPKISLNQEVDLSWLINMIGPTGPILKAVMQNKLKMDELGAIAESAFAFAVSKGRAPPIPPSYFIDGPFIIWFERTGCPLPVFAAYITEDDWKDPKSE